MKLVPIDGSFATEVRGVDLWRRADPETAAALRDAFTAHPILVFRRQILDEGQLMWFGGAVGQPAEYAEAHWQSEYRQIVLLSNLCREDGTRIGGTANAELKWHMDQSYYARPVTGCFLYAVLLPKDGGATAWADLRGAYERLPAELRAIADEAVGTFSYRARVNAGRRKNDNHDAERLRSTPDVKHRLVNVHPVTGNKSLYLDPRTVTAVDGMSEAEAGVFLSELERHATHERNVYRHRWQVGDLVLWDNAVLLHRRDAFPGDQHRLLKRMIIELPDDRHVAPAPVS